MDDLKKSIWCHVIQKAYGKDFHGRVVIRFEAGKVMSADPPLSSKMQIKSRALLPCKEFDGTITLDCNTFTGTIIESVT